MFTQKQTRGSLWMGVAAVLTMTSAVAAQLAGSAVKSGPVALQSDPVVVSSPASGSVGLLIGSEWVNLGFALSGVTGAPKFKGIGTFTPGHRCTLMLTDAAPNALAVIFVSLDSAPKPFKGGTLVPAAPAYTSVLTTDSVGAIYISIPSGASLPAGLDLVMQYAIADVAAPQGVALSNAILTSTH